MRLNHILIIAHDINEMKDFWINIIGLKQGERPPFPFKGCWLYSEGQPLVHLIESQSAVYGSNSIAHIAFEGADFQTLLNRLNNSEFHFTEKSVPMTDERQVFITEPDGITVEMLFPLLNFNQQINEYTTRPNKSYNEDENKDYLGGNLK